MNTTDYGKHADRPGYVPGLVWLITDTGHSNADAGWYRVSQSGKNVELVAPVRRGRHRA